MSWEEYGIRILAHAQQQEDAEAELYLNAWLNHREVAAVRNDKYVYCTFNDFYKRDKVKSTSDSFERLREITKRVQNLERR